MLYLEQSPAPPLSEFVRSLWYARGTDVAHTRERILPTGRVQVILNLARDFLLDCPEGEADCRMPPALVVGARSTYEIVDTSDMADLIGIVFAPGGFGLFAGDAVDLFSNRSVDLEAVWGGCARGLRDRMRELRSPELRLRCLESFLREWIAPRLTRHGPWPPGPQSRSRSGEVAFALRAFDCGADAATVREVARRIGWSERRFSQIFRESVGLSPVVWRRVQRFQRAVQQLHAGVEVRWAELALDCGFYDQSHFANEFRAFSGIDATTYAARRTQWANHIAVD
jgi:AraC-like DNA-binding protein